MYHSQLMKLCKAVAYVVPHGANVLRKPKIQIIPINRHGLIYGKDGAESAGIFNNKINFRINNQSASSRIGHSHQVRYISHFDMKVPNFDKYRRESVKNPAETSTCSHERRSNFTYLVMFTEGLAAAYSCKAIVTHYISFMSASAEVLALAQIEIKLADIPVGNHVTFKWRGKPLFIWHRTPETIAEVRAVPVNTLRDPETDESRTKQEDWLVVIGVCTHLGCVPIANAGDYGGYYCPCHGSHFDASGRIRKGPAPLNLEVPPYELSSEGVLRVG